MNLYNQHYLYLLLLLIPIIYGLLRWNQRLKSRFHSFAEDRFFAYYLGQRSQFFSALKLSLLILALVAIIFAIVRPQWDFEAREFDAAGLDIMIAVDVSKSMDATDMSPSRLIRAKIQIASFIDKLSTDRVGIMAFAGAASLECPLTDDYESIKMILNSLTTDTVPKPGTDIGAVLEASQNAFMSAGGKHILVLISDGEDLEADAIATAKRLKSKGIVIYTMGVGSETGIEIRDPFSGQTATTKLDVRTLKEIAAATGGEFYAVTPGQNEIRLLLDRIYASEKSKLYSKNISSMKEQYHIFAFIALLILIIESLFHNVRRTKNEA
ncbi:MAG: hypothetical protein CVU48_10415 [Candidatus Cloacimonetes bacterium HGW-Cloacimonetes-1]|jgi:Ca-activated chloride channel family protein|nr:MAG: hypothetical protein CVU48_10415 [Candidatus Cloacimonetes bacterium HGW-Cloacimonetes-1]